MHIIELCGLPRTGKTTLKRLLLERLPDRLMSVTDDRQIAAGIVLPYDNPMWQVQFMHALYTHVLSAERAAVSYLVLDRGFNDQSAWIDTNGFTRQWKEFQYQALSLLKPDERHRYSTFVMGGVDYRVCKSRHAELGFTQDSDIAMERDELLQRLQAYYEMPPFPHIRLDANRSPGTLVASVLDAVGEQSSDSMGILP